jgi:hypothetical protein
VGRADLRSLPPGRSGLKPGYQLTECAKGAVGRHHGYAAASQRRGDRLRCNRSHSGPPLVLEELAQGIWREILHPLDTAHS